MWIHCHGKVSCRPAEPGNFKVHVRSRYPERREVNYSTELTEVWMQWLAMLSIEVTVIMCGTLVVLSLVRK